MRQGKILLIINSFVKTNVNNNLHICALSWTSVETHSASAHTRMSNLRLLVVLHGHGDDVEPDDDGDEQVQVVAGAHLVDDQAGGGVVRVVRLTLSFCWKFGEGGERGGGGVPFRVPGN